MPTFLQALSIQNYRGIGNDYQVLDDLLPINFFIGSNNAGKSTVLNLISRHLPLNSATGRFLPKNPIDPLERFGGTLGAAPAIGIGVSIDKIWQKLWNPLPENGDKSFLEKDFSKFLSYLQSSGSHVWHRRAIGTESSWELAVDFQELKTNVIAGKLECQRLWTMFTRSTGGEFDTWLSELLKVVSNAIDLNLPQTRLIPAIRQIGPKGTAFDNGNFSGVGLIDRLAEAQSPDYDKREDRHLFERINNFVQIVTGEPEARIEIPHGREHVLVHMNERILPLSSLGTGIHEVIMIAAFCTLSDQEIICIEEPELHLHPSLQRKLIRYLIDNTNNQYFIATHSASFIDTPGAAIFHVRLENNQTVIRRAELDRDRFEICLDLGHRASDIIQANAVIWVEGPSDRIYLKHWIAAVAPELREGTHYSIMFYGGRLLSHLSADDDDVNDFIKLRALNRHVALIMDSDKETAHKGVNATKKRLLSEFEKNGGVAWLTKGREIENYVPHATLQEAVSAVSGARYVKPADGGQYDHALYYYEATFPKKAKAKGGAKLQKSVDKVKIARSVSQKPAQLDILDLRERLTKLVNMINFANGL